MCNNWCYLGDDNTCVLRCAIIGVTSEPEESDFFLALKSPSLSSLSSSSMSSSSLSLRVVNNAKLSYGTLMWPVIIMKRTADRP